MFECVESCFRFNRCLRQGSAEAPRLWQKMATQILANVEEEWMRKRNGILLDLEGEAAHQMCSFLSAHNLWIVSHSKENLEQMLRDPIEEANRWDLKPKPASLWWTSTYDSDEQSDMKSGTTSGCCTFSFEDTFKILGWAMNRQGKTYDAGEERMQSANMAFWKDQRLVDHVHAVFASETWVAFHIGTCAMARKIWIKMGLSFLYEISAESMWRAMGWVCDEKSNAVINSVRKVFSVEKYEMVALLTNKNDERISGKPHKTET